MRALSILLAIYALVVVGLYLSVNDASMPALAKEVVSDNIKIDKTLKGIPRREARRRMYQQPVDG